MITEIAFVHDHLGGFLRQTCGEFEGRLGAKDKTDIPSPECLGCFLQPSQHEIQMPIVGIRELGVVTESDQQRAAVLVGEFDRIFQCEVLLRAMGSLHKIENVLSLPIHLGVVENFYPTFRDDS